MIFANRDRNESEMWLWSEAVIACRCKCQNPPAGLNEQQGNIYGYLLLSSHLIIEMSL